MKRAPWCPAHSQPPFRSCFTVARVCRVPCGLVVEASIIHAVLVLQTHRLQEPWAREASTQTSGGSKHVGPGQSLPGGAESCKRAAKGKVKTQEAGNARNVEYPPRKNAGSKARATERPRGRPPARPQPQDRTSPLGLLTPPAQLLDVELRRLTFVLQGFRLVLFKPFLFTAPPFGDGDFLPSCLYLVVTHTDICHI